MAVTFGFFNSLNSDRLYNADQMSNYFKGLITNGVYESVDDALIVKATTGMTISVGTGRAIIDCKWINVDAIVTLTINASHVTLNRYTAICLHLDSGNRLIEIIAVDGTNATTPTKPIPTNTSTDKYLVLAYVYVGAGATAITQSNITDTRANTNICGWVTGLIKQVDTSELFLQWQDAYETYYAEMTAAFDSWLSTLTSQLNVNTFIQAYKKRAVLDGSSNVISLDMTGYVYSSDDIIDVYINGLYADVGIDYTLDTTGSTPTVTTVATASGTVVTIKATKSRIGFNTIGTSDGIALVTENNQQLQS
ncbi:MAG: hypothetical protein J6Q86_03425 [Methanobrevibacter sp.]|nr:hypothetical protein [Methanobrevibacter sp.]